ncbi:MAG: tetratricopeptide repeat protein [Anaerolineae bacterium]
MTTSEGERWLQAGITAVRAGDKAKGRELLLQVIEVDEENELAWLWLSGVVADDEERRICLENVLTINPENQAAKKGLAKLGPPPAQPFQEFTVRKEYQAKSLAGAILYPEDQIKEWKWKEPQLSRQTPQVEIAATSSFDDVWSQNVDLCPFCAQKLAYEDSDCPHCQRHLITKQFRYEKPSANLHIFWVFLLGLGNLYFIQAIYDLIAYQAVGLALGHVLLMVWLIVLTFAVYHRQFWAFAASLATFIALLLGRLVGEIWDINLAFSGIIEADETIRTMVASLIYNMGGLLQDLQLGAAGLGLGYGLFAVMPDFARDSQRQVAELKRGLQYGADYHNAARKFAQKEMWATAVLHWQRAAANAPNQLTYQRHLGLAYARLGFFERSLNVLTAAKNRVTNEETRAKFDNLIRAVKQKHSQNSSP